MVDKGILKRNMSGIVRKRTSGFVRPAKIQISLRIRAVWSESSLGAFWIAKDAEFLQTDNEDSDRTAHMSEGMFSHVVAQTRISQIQIVLRICTGLPGPMLTV